MRRSLVGAALLAIPSVQAMERDFDHTTQASTTQASTTGIWSGGRGFPETVTVYEIGQATLMFTQPFSENADLHHTFSFGRGLRSTPGFVIDRTSPQWLAIDNIGSSSAPIPEPGAWALMLAGLFAPGAAVRRR